MHRPGAKVGRGRGRRHFTAFAELFSLLFLVVSFQDSLSLEEPVKVLKVGL